MQMPCVIKLFRLCTCLAFFFFLIYSFLFLKGEDYTRTCTYMHLCVLRKKNNKKKETTSRTHYRSTTFVIEFLSQRIGSLFHIQKLSYTTLALGCTHKDIHSYAHNLFKMVFSKGIEPMSSFR